MSSNSKVTLTLSLKGNAGAELHRIGLDQIAQAKRVNEQLNLGAKATGKMSQMGQQVNATLKEQVRQTSLLTHQLETSTRQAGMFERYMEQSALQSHALLAAIRGLSLERTVRQTKDIADNIRETESSWRKMSGRGLATAASIAAGAWAGAQVLKGPLVEKVARDNITATEGTGMTVAQRVAHQKILNATIEETARKGGGIREDAEVAANTLLASGQYSMIGKDAQGNDNATIFKGALLQSQKTAFASGSTAEDIAKMNKSLKIFGIKDAAGLEIADDKAFRSGQMGAFELKDMARYLPAQLALAKGAGFRGQEGLTRLLTMNQLSMKTAGTPEQAAINIEDLLGLFSQNHFQLAMGKYIKTEKGDPLKKIGLRGNRIGFDYITYAAGMREKGIDQVTATAMLMQRQFTKNPAYVKLQSRLYSAQKGHDKSAELDTLNAMSDIVSQGEVGKIFHNKQSLMAFMAMTGSLGAGGDQERIMKGTNNSKGAVSEAKAVLDESEFAGAQRLGLEKQVAQNSLYDKISVSLGNFEKKLSDFAIAHPEAATTSYGAGLAVAAVAAAGVVGGVVSKLVGGGAGGASGALGEILGPPTRAKFLTRAAGRTAGTLGAAMLVEDAVDFGFRATGFGAGIDQKDRRDRHRLDWMTGKYDDPFLPENDPRQQQTGIFTSILDELRKLNNKPAPIISLDGRVVSEQVTIHSTTQSNRGAATNAGSSW
jgi:hypothetical protein